MGMLALLMVLPLALAGTGCAPGATPTPTDGGATPTTAPGSPTSGPTPTPGPALDLGPYRPTAEEKALLEAELRGAFDFFYGTANDDPASKGYGLIPDRMPGGEAISSIASVGYGLAALCIGAERGFAPEADLRARALGTLKTLYDNVQQDHGFFYHFLDMKTARRAWSSEVSVIDTAICLDGVLMAGAYFGGDVQARADEVYQRVDWPWYASASDGKRFSMGYSPEQGFFGAWDMTAEQFMMYFLGAGSTAHPVPGSLFYGFARPLESYGGLPNMVRSPAGSLFVYQFSHAWFDLRHTKDGQNVDWFRNSTIAALANRRYAMDQPASLGTGALDWGFTASDGPNGYEGGYGAKPGGGSTDGTVAPYGAAGSVVFAPVQSLRTLMNMKETLGAKGLWGAYGFQDAYNRSRTPAWIGPDVIGIDKGVSMLMIENYLTGFVWRTMSGIPAVQAGMLRCGVAPADEVLLSSFEEGADGGAPAFAKTERATGVAASGAAVSVARADANRGSGALRVAAEKDGTVAFALADGTLGKLADAPVGFRLSAKGIAPRSLSVRLLDATGGAVATLAAGDAAEATPSAYGEGWTDLLWTVQEPRESLGIGRATAVEVSFGGAGTYLLDDLAFVDRRTRAYDVMVDGARKVGETARFVWQGFDPRGRPLAVHTVRWVSSASPSGPWEPIADATGAEYAIAAADVGRFVAAVVVFAVGEGEARELLPAVVSEPSGKVLA